MNDQETNEQGKLNETSEHVKAVEKIKATNANRIIAVRVIWYIAGVLLVLLAFRFVLALLGANQQNGFANFIFSTTYPFALPFFSLFSYTPTYGVAQLESSVLVAMAVYALAAWGITKLVNITRPV